MKRKFFGRTGFTLMELIVSSALLVILIAVGVIVMNPAGQFAQGRNGQRRADLNTLLLGIRENMGDNRGTFTCAAGDLPATTSLRMASSGPGTYNIAPCLVTTYLFTLPYDPAGTSTRFNSVTDYDTGYLVMKNASGQITLSAPLAELGETISITR